MAVRASIAAVLLHLALPAGAQVPNTLLHAIPAPLSGLQAGAQLGYSVAVDGNYAVVGAPFDDLLGVDAGIVKVFDTTSGALLFVLPSPTPAEFDQFGYSVAISGTRVVVGAYADDTGGVLDVGSAYVYDLASGTPTVPVHMLNNPSPAAADRFGWSVAISGSQVVVGVYGDDTGATDAGSTYVYDLASGTPTVPVHTLNNPSPAAGDQFGYSAAISGTQVVVGVYKDDTGATDAGSAYVYDLTNVMPTMPTYTLNNPSPAAGDRFGWSVAISGSRVVVGAYEDDTGATDAGSAYVYDLSSGTPTVPLHTLSNPSPAFNDEFGLSVSVSGTWVVIGASNNNSSQGSAYVYDLVSGTPTVPLHTLNNPGPQSSDQFGCSVSISDNRVLVGAFRDNTGANGAGSAYVYDITSGTPTVPVHTLNNPGLAASDQFSTSVAVSGTRVVIGAFRDDTTLADSGRVYVYDLSSSTPTVPVYALNNPSPSNGDLFGASVAVSGARVVVGAYEDDTGASEAGSAYVFDLAGTTPTAPLHTLNNPEPAHNDEFGYSVAISGTLLVVGAILDDAGGSDTGSAYVYDLASGTPTVPLHTLNNPGPAANDRFGSSVAISGTRVVVGAYWDDTGATNAGSAYVYDLNSGTPTVPTKILNNPGPAPNEQFGFSVAISGMRAIVGAAFNNTGGTPAGSAYLYDLAIGTPTVPVHAFNNPDPASFDYFGHSVAISGTQVVIGAIGDNTGAGNAGSAYVYNITSGTPTVPVATLNNPDPEFNDLFGYAVAIDGTTTVIGTPYDDTVMTDNGYAYVYGPHPLDQDSDLLRDAWEITHFSTTAGHGPLDDFDNDGYKDLLEMALGFNPTISNPGGSPGVTQESGYLTMTLTKQPGVSYEVQTAGTLLTGQPDSFSAASTMVLINDATTLKVRDNVLNTAATARFIRVQVTGAP